MIKCNQEIRKADQFNYYTRLQLIKLMLHNFIKDFPLFNSSRLSAATKCFDSYLNKIITRNSSFNPIYIFLLNFSF